MSIGGTPNTLAIKRALFSMVSLKSMSREFMESICHSSPPSSSKGRPAFWPPVYCWSMLSLSRRYCSSVRLCGLPSLPLTISAPEGRASFCSSPRFHFCPALNTSMP